jgi:hypothetical protein
MISPAPMIIAKTRRIIRRFEEADATSPRKARTIDELGLYHGLIFKRLLKQGVIIEASPRRYYLSRENTIEYERVRQTRIKIMLVIMAVIVIIAVIYSSLMKQ